MIDRKRVIANLTRCQHCLCDECDLEHASHYPLDCEAKDQFIDDALELLKGQEPVEPHIKKNKSGTSWWYSCGNCNMALDPNDKYCRNCGRAVKWDG